MINFVAMTDIQCNSELVGHARENQNIIPFVVMRRAPKNAAAYLLDAFQNRATMQIRAKCDVFRPQSRHTPENRLCAKCAIVRASETIRYFLQTELLEVFG